MKFTWIDQLSEHQITEVLALMKNEWWCNNRELNDVKKMLDNCDVLVAALDSSGDIAGFARVLTDYTYKALLFDVIVKPNYRNVGLGKDIVNRILSLPELDEVNSFELYCPDRLTGFYENLGFSISDSKLMRNRL